MNSSAPKTTPSPPSAIRGKLEEPVSIEGTGELSVAGFKKAVEANDKPVIKVYNKVLNKANKKLSKKVDHPARINPWNAHVQQFRAANPKLTFKEVLQQAKASYKLK